MTDLEKTIQDIKSYLASIQHEREMPEEKLLYDAISLLKAQQPKKIRCIVMLTKVMRGICPSCEMTISSTKPPSRMTKFCQFCGQAVKWE